MTDIFATVGSGLDSPASKAFAITPNTDNDLAIFTRGIYVGGAGNVIAILVDDTAAVTFTAVPAGSILPIRARRVLATSTATTMVGML